MKLKEKIIYNYVFFYYNLAFDKNIFYIHVAMYSFEYFMIS